MPMISNVLVAVGAILLVLALLAALGIIGASWVLLLIAGVVCLVIGWVLRSSRRSTPL